MSRVNIWKDASHKKKSELHILSSRSQCEKLAKSVTPTTWYSENDTLRLQCKDQWEERMGHVGTKMIIFNRGEGNKKLYDNGCVSLYNSPKSRVYNSII